MQKILASLLLSAAALGLAGEASAAPFVQTGSTYSIYLGEESTGDALLVAPVFDGAPEGAVWRGLNVTFTESETELDNGQSLISIQVRASGEIFPTLNDTAIYGIGTFGDALDFLSAVALFDARVSFFDANNRLIDESGNLASDVAQNYPWDGLFPAGDGLFGTEGIGGRGVMGINFDFYIGENVAEVPAPAGVMLYGLGLLAMCGARRRSRHRA